MKNTLKLTMKANALFDNFTGENLDNLLKIIYHNTNSIEVIISRVSKTLYNIANKLEIEPSKASYVIEKFIRNIFNTESLEDKLILTLLTSQLAEDIELLFEKEATTEDAQEAKRLIEKIFNYVLGDHMSRQDDYISKVIGIYLYNKLSYVPFQDSIIGSLMQGIKIVSKDIESIKDNSKFLLFMEKSLRNVLTIFIDTYTYMYETDMIRI